MGPKCLQRCLSYKWGGCSINVTIWFKIFTKGLSFPPGCFKLCSLAHQSVSLMACQSSPLPLFRSPPAICAAVNSSWTPEHRLPLGLYSSVPPAYSALLSSLPVKIRFSFKAQLTCHVGHEASLPQVWLLAAKNQSTLSFPSHA